MKKKDLVSKIALFDGAFTFIVFIVCLFIPSVKSFIAGMGVLIYSVFGAYLFFNMVMDFVYLILAKHNKNGQVIKGIVIAAGMFKIVITVLCLLGGLVLVLSKFE